MIEQIQSGRGAMALSIAMVLAYAVPVVGCNDSEVAVLREQLAVTQQREASLREEVGRLKAVIAQHDAREAEALAAEAAVTAEKEAKWSSIRGRYRCTGGILTGLIVRDGFAQAQMGGLEALQGSPNFRADVRNGTLYITDPVRGAAGFRIVDGGARLVPQSSIYGTSCRRADSTASRASAEPAAVAPPEPSDGVE